VYDNYGTKNNLLTCFGKTEFSQFCCLENTEKLIRVVKVQLRQKRQQKNRVLAPLLSEPAKTGRFTETPIDE